MKTNQVLFLTSFEECLFRELNKNQNQYDATASSNETKNLIIGITEQFMNIGLLSKLSRNENIIYFEFSKLGKKLLSKKAIFSYSALPSGIYPDPVYIYILD